MRVVIRLSGEIAVKSQRVRRQFQRQLRKNIRRCLKDHDIDFTLEEEWSRFYLETASPLVTELLMKIFGIQSFSVVEKECQSSLDQIVKHGTDLYWDRVADQSYAVKAKRSGNHDFSSMDVQKELGAALNRSSGFVCLDDPQVPVHVEIRNETTYFYSEVIKGPGGLPLGSGGHASCLISGGFDSAVAAWMLQKRGVTLEYLFCNVAEESYERAVLQVSKVLADHWSFGHRPRIHVVDFSEIVKDLKSKVTPKFSQVILKRLFYRAADKLNEAIDSKATVTGEAIGQVSSQTLTNLRAIDEVAEFPIMRPLIAFDKEDIIQISRKIGTFQISSKVQEFCQLVPDKPVTACKVSSACKEESKLDLSLLDQAFETRKILDLSSLTKHQLSTPYIFKQHIPEGSVVIDCRSKDEFEKGHLGDAIHKEYYDLLEEYKLLPKNQVYLLYCSVGMQTALLAEKMQSDGYMAYSYKGGVQAMNLVQ